MNSCESFYNAQSSVGLRTIMHTLHCNCLISRIRLEQREPSEIVHVHQPQSDHGNKDDVAVDIQLARQRNFTTHPPFRVCEHTPSCTRRTPPHYDRRQVGRSFELAILSHRRPLLLGSQAHYNHSASPHAVLRLRGSPLPRWRNMLPLPAQHSCGG